MNVVVHIYPKLKMSRGVDRQTGEWELRVRWNRRKEKRWIGIDRIYIGIADPMDDDQPINQVPPYPCLVLLHSPCHSLGTCITRKST